ncbi:hypothetical protein TNCV_4578371 [Trichonephila clavipes]|nr:hypothetical protein TNCV_4578371 [Trichonephila clavipes]
MTHILNAAVKYKTRSPDELLWDSQVITQFILVLYETPYHIHPHTLNCKMRNRLGNEYEATTPDLLQTTLPGRATFLPFGQKPFASCQNNREISLSAEPGLWSKSDPERHLREKQSIQCGDTFNTIVLQYRDRDDILTPRPMVISRPGAIYPWSPHTYRPHLAIYRQIWPARSPDLSPIESCRQLGAGKLQYLASLQEN